MTHYITQLRESDLGCAWKGGHMTVHITQLWSTVYISHPAGPLVNSGLYTWKYDIPFQHLMTRHKAICKVIQNDR